MKKTFWDIIAPFYEHFMLTGERNQQFYSDLSKIVCSRISANDKVLELAMGPAMLTGSIAASCESIIATDYSENMVRQASKKHFPGNVHLMRMDATDIKFPDGKFDVVVIANALHIMPYPEKALVEIRRVLKDTGILIAPTFISHNLKSFRMKFLSFIGFKMLSKWTIESYRQFLRVMDWR